MIGGVIIPEWCGELHEFEDVLSFAWSVATFAHHLSRLPSRPPSAHTHVQRARAWTRTAPRAHRALGADRSGHDRRRPYRLLKAVMETAVYDELIRRNPCRLRSAGKEGAAERQIATVAQVDALAGALGPRRRLMIFSGRTVHSGRRNKQSCAARTWTSMS
ncbi:hypothetical protein GCM10010393_11250 [Streptomyces gobitricini]|uniref:Uncharacterized protein n=1 Tax=Streptomyces gobitricini TaxID=68211 RepID=A0ABN3LE40_9ACTN